MRISNLISKGGGVEGGRLGGVGEEDRLVVNEMRTSALILTRVTFTLLDVVKGGLGLRPSTIMLL